MELKINSPKYGEKIVLIDDEDFERVKDYKWYVYKENNKFYVRAHIKKSINYSKIRLHRCIMDYKGNLMVDHINGNPLDNRKCNLRICNCSQNNMNSLKHKIGSSKYKGVSFDKSRNKYEAYITLNKKKIHLGRFEKETDAAKEYDKASIIYFGEFAKDNINIMMQ